MPKEDPSMALTPGLEPRNRFRDHSLADCRLTIRLISAFGTRTRSRTSLCWFRANRATDIPYGCIGVADRNRTCMSSFGGDCNICNGAAHRIRTCKSLLTRCLQNTVLTARTCSVLELTVRIELTTSSLPWMRSAD